MSTSKEKQWVQWLFRDCLYIVYMHIDAMTYMRAADNLRCWFSPSTDWVWEIDLGHQACEWVLLPTLCFHWTHSYSLWFFLTLHCMVLFIFDNHLFLMIGQTRCPSTLGFISSAIIIHNLRGDLTVGKRQMVLLSDTDFLYLSEGLFMATLCRIPHNPAFLTLTRSCTFLYNVTTSPHIGCFSLTHSSILN